MEAVQTLERESVANIRVWARVTDFSLTGLNARLAGVGRENVSDVNHRQGQYLDAEGIWQPERRSGKDRRAGQVETAAQREQRKFLRRKMDREVYEREHKAMIREALDEFAAEHEH